MHVEKEDQTKERLGVSVHYLQTTFLDEVIASPQRLSRDSTIYEVEDLEGNVSGVIRRKGANRICPMDEKQGAAYVHCLRGDDNVGLANYMLSYSWSYTIGDIVDTLVDFCRRTKKDPKRTYVWICCLCINQHRVVDQKNRTGMLTDNNANNSSPIDFLDEFGKRVKRIGSVLAMMQPWDSPRYLERIWCIFELYTAHMEGCEISIIMPPSETEKLEQALFGNTGKNIDALYEVLAKTRVQKAKATVDTDRTTILDLVQRKPGYSILNHKVNELLRDWVRRQVAETIDKREKLSATSSELVSFSRFCSQTCKLLLATGEFDAAQEMAEKALAVQIHRDDEECTIVRANAYNDLGEALDNKGDYQGALMMYQKSLQLRESVLAPQHPKIATSHNYIGATLKNQGDYHGALLECRHALAIREAVLGHDHPDTAFSYYCIGNILSSKGDFEGALVDLRRGLDVWIRTMGDKHPQTARAHNNIGDVLLKKGDHDAALCDHEKALEIRLALLGQDHPDTAWSFYRIGTILAVRGSLDEALLKLRRALEIDETLLRVDHPDLATIRIEIGNVLACKDDYDGAYLEYNTALEIQRSCLGHEHPSTKATIENIMAVRDKTHIEKREHSR